MGIDWLKSDYIHSCDTTYHSLSFLVSQEISICILVHFREHWFLMISGGFLVFFMWWECFATLSHPQDECPKFWLANAVCPTMIAWSHCNLLTQSIEDDFDVYPSHIHCTLRLRSYKHIRFLWDCSVLDSDHMWCELLFSEYTFHKSTHLHTIGQRPQKCILQTSDCIQMRNSRHQPWFFWTYIPSLPTSCFESDHCFAISVTILSDTWDFYDNRLWCNISSMAALDTWGSLHICPGSL